MPRIFDCFTFFNENDLLALRIQELDSVVDTFVLVQASQTFRGKPKPDYLDYDRFRPWIDSGKLVVWNVEKFPRFMDTWGREEYQRNEIEIALEALPVDGQDLIILTDIDEIPSRKTVEVLQACWGGMVRDIVRLRLKKFSYAINMLTDEGNTAGKVFSYHMLKENTPQQLRKMHVSNIIEDAGWEFSSLGTVEDILLKFRSFAHSEFDHVISKEVFKHRIRSAKDLLGRDINHEVVEIDDTWPEGIKNNREYWSKYEWISD